MPENAEGARGMPIRFFGELERGDSVKYSIGFLVLGSLYWDTHPVRKRWRKEFFSPDSHVKVHAPIRYGRLSRCRDETYTMVVSKELDGDPSTLGECVFVPSNFSITSPESLVNHAEALWDAERKKSGAEAISAKWGSVGLLVRPESGIAPELLDGWKRRVKQEKHYGTIDALDGFGERTMISRKDGTVDIAWPQTTSRQSLDVDLALVVATNPELKGCDYPDPTTIASAWNKSPAQVDYFKKNAYFGICTFQDDDIEKVLNCPDFSKRSIP